MNLHFIALTFQRSGLAIDGVGGLKARMILIFI